MGDGTVATIKDFDTGDLVTKTDKAVEDFIHNAIREKHPSHAFIAEKQTDEAK